MTAQLGGGIGQLSTAAAPEQGSVVTTTLSVSPSTTVPDGTTVTLTATASQPVSQIIIFDDSMPTTTAVVACPDGHFSSGVTQCVGHARYAQGQLALPDGPRPLTPPMVKTRNVQTFSAGGSDFVGNGGKVKVSAEVAVTWLPQKSPPPPPKPKARKLVYNGGPLMASSTSYAIFWRPEGRHYLPSGKDAFYELGLEQYFRDVGGTPFYGLLSQYGVSGYPIKNRSTEGGTYVDTTPYPGGASRQHPLKDQDIAASISRALKYNGWDPGPNKLFFVFTADGAENCSTGSSDKRACSFRGTDPSYCAYHAYLKKDSIFGLFGKRVYFAVITDPHNHCMITSGQRSYPHKDAIIDSAISETSHEHFEAVTDPENSSIGSAWFYQSSQPGWTDPRDLSVEIGDKCAYKYGTVNGDDGHNIRLNDRNYVVQMEWSNQLSRCTT